MRPCDVGVAEEMREYDSLIVEGVTLDIGGHIGLFAEGAFHRGATRVVSVEPEPSNVELLRQRMRNEPRHITIEAACIGNHELITPLYVNGGLSQSHTVFFMEGRRTITVPTVNFGRLLEFVRPTTLKIDVEGAEYLYNLRDLPTYVKHLAVEFHFLSTMPESYKSHQAIPGFRETYRTPEERNYKLHVYERKDA